MTPEEDKEFRSLVEDHFQVSSMSASDVGRFRAFYEAGLSRGRATAQQVADEAIKDAERNGANKALRTFAIALEKFAPAETEALKNVATAAHAHWLEQIRIHDGEQDYRFKFSTAYGTLAKLGEALASLDLSRLTVAVPSAAQHNPENECFSCGCELNDGEYYFCRPCADAKFR